VVSPAAISVLRFEQERQVKPLEQRGISVYGFRGSSDFRHGKLEKRNSKIAMRELKLEFRFSAF
jgi:hypothetical protein